MISTFYSGNQHCAGQCESSRCLQRHGWMCRRAVSAVLACCLMHQTGSLPPARRPRQFHSEHAGLHRTKWTWIMEDENQIAATQGRWGGGSRAPSFMLISQYTESAWKGFNKVCIKIGFRIIFILIHAFRDQFKVESFYPSVFYTPKKGPKLSVLLLKTSSIFRLVLQTDFKFLFIRLKLLVVGRKSVCFESLNLLTLYWPSSYLSLCGRASSLAGYLFLCLGSLYG